MIRRRPPSADIARWAILTALALVMFLPVYVTFVSGFFPTGALTESGLFPPLHRLTLGNFREALAAVPLGRQFLVSVVVVALQTAAELVTSSLAAYALVFPRWRGRAVAFAFVVATLAVPGESLIIPNYELVTRLGLHDTIIAIVLPFLAMGYPIFLLRQAFAAIPHEMWEAARLDGCGDLRALLAVILPTCRPQVTTAALWAALGAWNGFFWPLLITDTSTKRTVQVGLAQLVTSENAAPSVIFAGTALVLVPTVVLVVASQRFLLRGLAGGIGR